MHHFLELTFSFPVVVFSFLLCIVVLYWALACFGLVDIDALNIEIDSLQEANGLQPEGMAGLLLKVGLSGVPVRVVFTVLVVIGWFFSYFMQLLLFSRLALDLLYFPVGAVLAIVAFMASVPVTSVVIRPFRTFLRTLEDTSRQSILGQTAVVRSSVVTGLRGEVMLSDGGAGLIFQVRTDEAKGFKRGDRVVLLQYIEEARVYQVISESEFKG